jgi:hypothetical protein
MRLLSLYKLLGPKDHSSTIAPGGGCSPCFVFNAQSYNQILKYGNSPLSVGIKHFRLNLELLRILIGMFIYLCILYIGLEHTVAWLRYYATSQKVAGSIPDEVIWFFNWPNPSCLTMTLGSTQRTTEMSTRNLPGGKRRLASKADNFTAICEPTV